MKNKIILLIVFTGVVSSAPFAQKINLSDLDSQTHPRILLLKGEEKAISQAIASNPVWGKMHQAITNQGNVSDGCFTFLICTG
jgi:hypothetical protein